MLLIHPPVSKPCEPPAGIARLAGALREHGVSCTLIDANVEGLYFLLDAQRVREGSEIWGNDQIASGIGIVSPDFSISSRIGVIFPDSTEVLKGGGRDRAGDTWTKRAVRSLPQHLQSLRSWPLYGHTDRYRRAVADINRVLAGSSSQISVTKDEDSGLNPITNPILPLEGRGSPRRPVISVGLTDGENAVRRRRRDNSRQVVVSLADYEDAVLSPINLSLIHI